MGAVGRASVLRAEHGRHGSAVGHLRGQGPSYGPNTADMVRQSATYVDRVLKGAKTRDLPVQQPTRFELHINLKTAKAFGLTIPESFTLLADRIIE